MSKNLVLFILVQDDSTKRIELIGLFGRRTIDLSEEQANKLNPAPNCFFIEYGLVSSASGVQDEIVGKAYNFFLDP